MSPILLRQAMIKNPHHRLWNKPLKDWTSKDKKEFNNLDYKPKSKKVWIIANSKKVIRVSDGLEYPSIRGCRLKNNLCKVTMYRKLEQGIEFKLKPLQ